MTSPFTRRCIALASVAALLGGAVGPATAQSEASEASALSALPIAVSIAAPVALLSAGATLMVVSVDASAAGSVWVLERASDGARATLRLSAAAVGGASAVAGTAVVVTAFSTGYVLSVASTVIAFIPNAIGASLLYTERVTL